MRSLPKITPTSARAHLAGTPTAPGYRTGGVTDVDALLQELPLRGQLIVRRPRCGRGVAGGRRRGLGLRPSEEEAEPVIDIDSDADADGVVVICEKAPVDKNKQHVAYPLHWPKLVKAPLPWLQKTAAEMANKNKPILMADDKVDEKYNAFKQFDILDDHSDHYYSKPALRHVAVVEKPSILWASAIQQEWKILEKDLPDTIFARAYEERIDLLRAVIMGPAGTPYHDGLFFFDILFPAQYTITPPLVNYRSGGLHLNPNLYVCRKVCLSLLNTWSGSEDEMWDPDNSTMLQVLVSIQALVLNAKPYFNEPGYAGTTNTPHGEKQSLSYNEDTFLLSCRTMLYSLRNPPKNFEDFVAGHFRKHRRNVLVACKTYLDGAQVGCLVGNGIQDVDEGDKSCSLKFKASLKRLFEELLMEFTVKGNADCDKFLAEKKKSGAASSSRAIADTTL
ncbi:hypothetical protein BRADI_2g04101v3 [Brachypodium distachyon]|uniref:E2 ubiquitin-conjugating enzyme n=1 Tax=Brachypodium distachyon TaxID=15368 RepID=A0A0Q3IAJ5_BRADI|nr:hypothetical protein BRADI_2g04101v3 [Brachypodium distachyon]